MKGRTPALVAVLLVVFVATSGCAGTGYTYVTSTSTGTFFKVPDGWRVYNQSAVVAHSIDTGATSGGQARLPFLVVIDGDPQPSLDHKLSASTHPFGLARVRSLSTDEHDTYSLASLRNEAIDVDTLLQTDPNAVQPLSAPKLLVQHGMRGTHLEYAVHNAGGGTFSVDQVGLVDAATHTVWFLLIGCSAQCYAQNSGAIHRVADSWTVKGK